MKQSLQMLIYICFIFVGFSTVGHGVASLGAISRKFSTGISTAQLSPFFTGLALVQLSGWYVLENTDSGIRRPLVLIGLVGCVGTTSRLFLDRKDFRTFGARSLQNNYVFLVSAVVFTVIWWPLLKLGYLTAAGSNNDLISYAQVAQHIENHGFTNAGRIVGANLGSTAKNDVSGAYIIVSFAHVLIRRPFNQVMFPVLGAFVAVLTQQVFNLIHREGRLRASLALPVVLVAQTTYMMTYIMGCFFLSQLIAMAVFAALVRVLVVARSEFLHSPTGWSLVPLLAPVMVLCVIMLFCYPHMLFVVVPIAVVALAPYKGWAKLGLFVASSAAWSISALAVAAAKAHIAVTRFIQLSADSVNGWKLPVITPIEMLGFQSSESLAPRLVEWVFSGILVAGVCVSLSLGRRDPTRKLRPALLLLLIGASYAYFSVTASFSYKQWKWTTFFIPVVVALMLWSFLTVASTRRIAHRMALAALLLLACMSVHNSWKFTRLVAETTTRVPYPMTQLSRNEEIAKLKRINVFAGDYSRSMWPALFLDPLEVNIVSPSYYSAPKPDLVPTVVDGSFPVDPWKRTDLGGGLALVNFPDGPNTATSSNVAASVEVHGVPGSAVVGQTFSIQAHITNAGVATWLGTGSTGAVELGARLLNSSTGKSEEVVGQSLVVPFPNYLAHGEYRDVEIQVTMPRDVGRFVLEVSPLIVGGRWFSDLSAASAARVPIVIG